MKITLEVLGLENRGDYVRVSGQGMTDRHAQWRPLLNVSFDAPGHIGERYRIGQKLTVRIDT